VKVIAQVKLNPTPEQHAALLATLQRANETCHMISAPAWQAHEFRRYPLQRRLYHDLRVQVGLGAPLLIRCIAKVADAYKLDRKVQRSFQRHGAIAFDDRILSWYTNQRAISICCVVCGHAAPADYNAAINIEWAALSAGLWCTALHAGVETQAQVL